MNDIGHCGECRYWNRAPRRVVGDCTWIKLPTQRLGYGKRLPLANVLGGWLETRAEFGCVAFQPATQPQPEAPRG